MESSPEILLLSAMIQTGQSFYPAQQGIKPSHFYTFKAEYEWITSYHETYAEPPSKIAFKTAFPDFRLLTTTELDFGVDEVKKNSARQATISLIKQASDHLKADEPFDALDLLNSRSRHIVTDTGSLTKTFELVDDWSDVYEDVVERVDKAKAQGLTGVATGFPTLDERTSGAQDGDLWIIAARLAQGKMLSDDTKILTPHGWCRNGDLRPGDKVIGSDGRPTEVIAVFPQGERQIYEVEFSDGSVIDAGDEHLWTVRVGSKPYKVQTTAQIMKHLESGQQRPSVPTLSAPVQFSEHEGYLYDPYKLGLLLGDGCFRGKGVQFSTEDSELVEVFGGNAVHHSRCDYGINRLKPTMEQMGLWGLYSHEKHVPDDYLTASVATRHALLQGLLDSDGGPTATGGVEFSTTSKHLAHDVQYLAETLGGHAHLHERYTSYQGKQGRLSYRLIVALPPEFAPFRLERKARLHKPRTKYQPARSIVDIRPLNEFTSMTCIAVDNPDSLYVTEHCIVTHNTWSLTQMAEGALMAGKKVLFVSLEQTWRQIAHRVHTILGNRLGYRIRHTSLSSGLNVDLDEYKTFLAELPSQVPGRLVITDGGRGRVTPVTLASFIEEHQPDVVYIDYITLMSTTDNKAAVEDWRAAASISADVKAIAMSYNIPIIAAAQINRLGEGGEKPPSVAKLSQTDALGQDASIVVTMRRASNHTAQYSLEKNRHGESGVVFWTLFKPDEGEFKEVTYQKALDQIIDDESGE